MKLISVTILFICTIAATFSSGLLITCFDLNKDYVAKELCINKNNSASHCNGHCFLNKQLDKEEKSNTPTNAAKEKFEIQLFFACEHENNKIILLAFIEHYTASQQFIGQEVLRFCFHPPSTV